MFQVGDIVVYANRGICRVEDITELNLPGAKSGKKYYEMRPISDESGKVYSAVDNDKVVMRRVLTKEEAQKLVMDIPDIPEMTIGDEKQRELKYKEAMLSCDCRQWVSIIKTLYTRRQNRLRQGKKTTNTDDRYFKRVSENLHGELAIALGMKKEEMESFISNCLDNPAQ
jgi:CarD family transcriptional regulator